MKIENLASCEIRSVIKFLNAKNVCPTEIYRQVCEVYGENAMTDGMGRRWYRMFSEGRANVHDDDRSGRPSLVTTDLLDQANEKIRENIRFTMSEPSTYFPHISCSLLHEIITEHLQYHKLCARLVPKMLTDDHKTKRMGTALNFLVKYHNNGNKFLTHIVTGYETLISHVTPENKQQSMQWWHSASPKAKKFKHMLSTMKTMCITFWDGRGVLLIDIMTQVTTVNANVYCETTRRAIQNRRRGLLSPGVLLLHDNTQPHTAARTRQLLEQSQWELAPSDFLFLHLKRFLVAERFSRYDEVKTAVQHWVKTAADFFNEGIQKLVP
jgi:histone-lysine N-methyltransferase SETMAR